MRMRRPGSWGGATELNRKVKGQLGQAAARDPARQMLLRGEYLISEKEWQKMGPSRIVQEGGWEAYPTLVVGSNRRKKGIGAVSRVKSNGSLREGKEHRANWESLFNCDGQEQPCSQTSH